MSQRKIGIILSYIHIFVTNTISLIYTPYMLHLMGQSEYGLYGTANSFISYLSVLSFGIGGAYIRFNARCRAKNDRDEEKRLNGMFLTIFGVLSLIVFVAGIIFMLLAGKMVEQTFSSQELLKLRIIMFILTMNMMMSFLFNVVMMALQAYEKFICIRVVLLIAGVVTPIINVVVLNLGGRAVATTFVSFVISLLSYLVFAIYARKAICLQFLFNGFKKDVLKELFVFSGYLFLNSVTDQITFSTDNMILSSVKGTVAVAVYSVGSNFKSYFLNFSSTISSVFASQINKIVAEHEDSEQLDELFIRIGRIQFYVVSLILIGYISIGYDFICLWAGKEYSNAYYIGLLLMLAVFVPSFQNVGLEIQKAKNMHKTRSIVYFLIALLNVMLTIPFSQKWGGIGAALATTMCMFCGTVLFMNWYYGKYVKLNISTFWKSIISILPGYIVPILCGIIINYYCVLESYIAVLSAAIVISVVFTGSVWIISMNDYEKNIVLKPIKKIISKLRK